MIVVMNIGSAKGPTKLIFSIKHYDFCSGNLGYGIVAEIDW